MIFIMESMDTYRIITARTSTFVLLLVLMRLTTNDAVCSITPELQGTYWTKYQDNSDILTIIGTETIQLQRQSDDSIIESYTCEDAVLSIEDWNYLARSQTANASAITCFRLRLGSERNLLIVWDLFSPDLAEANAILCESAMYIEPAQVLVRTVDPLVNPECPLSMIPGRYRVTYSTGTVTCTSDTNSVAQISTSGSITLDTCYSGTVDYQNPLKGVVLNCEGALFFADLFLGGTGLGNQVFFLSSTDITSARTVYYCARLETVVAPSPGKVYISIDTFDDTNLQCSLAQNSRSAESTSSTRFILLEMDPSDCDQEPCMNGGSCQQNLGSFTCNCSSGYTGTLCETVLRTVKQFDVIDNDGPIYGDPDPVLTCLAYGVPPVSGILITPPPGVQENDLIFETSHVLEEFELGVNTSFSWSITESTTCSDVIRFDGEYNCRTVNLGMDGRSRTSAALRTSVTARYQPLLQSDATANITANVGEKNVEVSCDICGNPTPTYVWYFQNEVVQISTDNNFVIREVQTENFGDYLCVVDSALGGPVNFTVYLYKLDDRSPADVNVSIIVGGTIAGIVVLIMVITGALIVIRRKQNSKSSSATYATAPKVYEDLRHNHRPQASIETKIYAELQPPANIEETLTYYNTTNESVNTEYEDITDLDINPNMVTTT